MENRAYIDPRYIDHRYIDVYGVEPCVGINRQKVKRAFRIALLGLALHFGGGAPSAVSAQGPETPTPVSTPTIVDEDLCIIDGDVWRGTVRMDGIQNSGEPDVGGMQVELTGSNGISKEDTTRSNGRYYFSGLSRERVYSLNFGGIIQKVVDLAREAHGKVVCFKKLHVEIPPGSPTPTNTATSTATENPTNTTTPTNTPTATETQPPTSTATQERTPGTPKTPETPVTPETPETPETPGTSTTPKTQTPTETKPPVTKTATKVPTPVNPPDYGVVNENNDGLVDGVLAAGVALTATGAWYVGDKKFQRYLLKRKRKKI